MTEISLFSVASINCFSLLENLQDILSSALQHFKKLLVCLDKRRVLQIFILICRFLEVKFFIDKVPEKFVRDIEVMR